LKTEPKWLRFYWMTKIDIIWGAVGQRGCVELFLSVDR